jgi:hypothetical protein
MAAIKKERIKDQMVKTAARLWEIPENEIEANFDPLVLLLIEACAAELERIGFKIRESHQRLVDRLAELLVPDSATGAYPSSCIVQAQSVESQAMVTPALGFNVQANMQGQDYASDTTRNIELTPVGEFPIHNIQLKYYGAGNKFYRYIENGGREYLAGKDSEKPSGNLWLLLSPGKNFESIKDLQLYFHLRNISEDQQFFFGLSQASCKINGQPVDVKQGYSTQYQFDLQPADMLSKGHHYHQKIKRNIASNYANRFLHVVENIDTSNRSLPPSLSWLPADVLKMIGGEALIFVEIQLPRNFSQDLLDALSIHVNAFPVANLSRHQVQYRSGEWINIIPLPVQGSFLDLVNVSSSTGHPYHFRYAAGKRQPNEGEAILRNTSIGNTSSYEIRSMAATLMDAIRDQYAFFSEVSNQSILNQLKEITILLNRLEDRIQESKDLVENKCYLLIRPIETGELISVDYYTTQGTRIQGVKLYSKVEPKRSATIAPGTSFIISPLLGGRDSPSASEKQLILKQQLLSRGRVVTAEDIRLICQQLFGANVSDVQIARTTKIEPGTQSGFAMYVTVTITLSSDNKLMFEELNYLSRQLEYQLAEGAIPGLPFEIRINRKGE